MAAILNLLVDQGATFSREIVLTDPLTGVVLDLTGGVVSSQFRKSYASRTMFSFDVTVASPPTAGTILLTLSAATSSGVRAGRYVYDVEVDFSGVVKRPLEGIVTVTPGVTRDDGDPPETSGAVDGGTF